MGIFERIIKRRPRITHDDRDGVATRMRELAQAGRYRDAIDYALPHTLRLGDPALHRELAHLRRNAAREAIASARPRPDWPPQLRDPFPDHTGIPEVLAADLASDIMAGAILHHGSLIVRGALERDEADGLAVDIDRVFAAHDAWIAGQPVESDAAWFSQFELDPEDEIAQARPWNRAGGGVLAADSPVLFNRLAELYQRRGLLGAIEGHLGERPLLSVGKTVLRRVEPQRAGDFHQDGAFLGAGVRTINVWIALSDCGLDSPGLEIVDRRVPAVVETGTEGAHFKWSVGREVARRANEGRPFARPVFRAGDALLFDQFMLHATSHDAAMHRARYAIESWFFAPSAYTEEQVALAI